ncbi:MAG: hypothetical protein ACYCS8_00010 [Acidithiobacillus sp.]
MHDNTQDNQQFIDAARARGEDTFMYMDKKSGECLLVSGSASSIKVLGGIVDHYEIVCEVVEAINTELLERWGRFATVSCRAHPESLKSSCDHNVTASGDVEHAQ